jgi:tetratricopeptide (TPR) repeat protein
MRTVALVGLVALIAATAACAAKRIAAPVATAARFPQLTQPPVPDSLAGGKAVESYNLGWRLLQGGDLKSAERAFAAALQTSPTFYPAEAATGYLDLVRSDPKGALPHFDRALVQRGDYVAALLGRGEALVALEREPEAIDAWAAALRADPSLVDISRRIDVLKFRAVEKDLAAARQAARDGRPGEAIRAYEAAVASSPESAFLYRELAAAEAQNGASDRALSHFRQATQLDPADSAAFAQMAGLLEARGDLDGALAAYDSALAIEPNDGISARRDAVRARAALAQLPEQYRAIGDSPEISRADLAALIGIGLPTLLQPVQTGDAVVMTDIRGGWAEPWIMTVVRAGILEPFENHTFQPGVIIHRVDLALAVNRLLQRIAVSLPASAKAWDSAPRVRFTDMPEGHLAYPAASAAVAAGVMMIGSGQAFEPTRAVTGAEAIQAIRRLETLLGPAAARGTVRP